MFSPNSMLVCGRIVLVARFLAVDCILEVDTFE